ncbi:hypothetical protein LshimejAT787_0401930 [Lyophyllum shimeji]|uniref:Uncharacterized protein n=1 Tax=Lyophyllum shimeji TaxID=47721 RepID=A0A9P3PKT3_LYOSH|nr:hypothetical protein LshimejAT787_0401930 [Lyophyllum shimeji]
MAPTDVAISRNGADRPNIATFRRRLVADRPQQVQASSIKTSHEIYHRRSQPKLWRRQSPGIHSVTNLPDPPPAPNVDSFVPYTPTMPIHANIIPLGTSPATPGTAGSSTTTSHLPVTEIILIATAALVAAALGLAGMILLRSLLIRKGLRVLMCCGRRQKVNKDITASENRGVLVKGDDFDESVWGTPTRFMHCESIHDGFEHDDIRDPGPRLDNSPPAPTMPACSPHCRRGSFATCDEDCFQDRLQVEENDIALALSVAFRDDIGTQDMDQVSTAEPNEVAEDTLSFPGHAENISILGSLQANIDSLAKGVSPPAITLSRPRYGSDSSASSQESSGRDTPECFSASTSSRSSMTSLGCTASDFNDEELDVVYEVKRAHAQSVEIKKGVLVACRPPASDDELTLNILPRVVISEPSPILLSFQDQNSRSTIHSFASSLSTTVSSGRGNTAPSMSSSSLVRENSRGTLGSLSTSFSATTRTEGWCMDDEGFLQPSIPHLIVTRPSDSSINTTDTDSSAGSVSVDLNHFPLPPTPVKTSYYTRLMDQVHGRKRVWDNHPAGSSVAQRRSTVERFIKMYSST